MFNIIILNDQSARIAFKFILAEIHFEVELICAVERSQTTY